MTTTVDVNQAFKDQRQGEIAQAFADRETAIARAAQRAADFEQRIANGELRPLGNGQFEVTSGWDKGEIWYQRNTEFGVLLLPQHGLDETTGKVALYSAEETWHGAGTVIPGGISDIDEVLQLGGIDFEVGVRPVRFQPGEDKDGNPCGPFETMPGKFCTFRKDTGAGLGTVGSIYTPFQNRNAFEFLQDLFLKYNVVWESAGATYNGAHVFVSCRLPMELHIDPSGINDEIRPFVVFINSHNGDTKVITCITPWRPVCGNTERFALAQATARWGHRHDKSVNNRIAEARRELELSAAYFDQFLAEETALAQTDIDIDEFLKTVTEVFEVPDQDAPNAERVRYQRQAANLLMRFESNAQTLGETAYAAERAFTEWLDHRPLRSRRPELKGNRAAAYATRILDGEDDKVKNTVHRRLMLRVR